MTARMPTAFLASLLVVGGACGGERRPAATGPDSLDAAVHVFGDLSATTPEEQAAEIVNLKAVLPRTHLYGLGVRSGLRGEIAIINGKAYLSSAPSGDSIRTEVMTESDEGALFLVTARVGEWTPAHPHRDTHFEHLEGAIAEMARSLGMDTTVPFVFLIDGWVTNLEYHVVDGSRMAGGIDSHEAHMKAIVRNRLEKARATLIGFYNEEPDIIAGKGRNTHIHVVVAEPMTAGHVDHVTIPEGAKFLFPARAVKEKPGERQAALGPEPCVGS